jgi:homoserine O-acetyltransferase
MKQHQIKFSGSFPLEAGDELRDIKITFHTLGTLTANSRVIWICHALIANSNAEDWWSGMVGEGKFFNGQDYFIIVAACF